jgi:hypothetical protein
VEPAIFEATFILTSVLILEVPLSIEFIIFELPLIDAALVLINAVQLFAVFESSLEHIGFLFFNSLPMLHIVPEVSPVHILAISKLALPVRLAVPNISLVVGPRTHNQSAPAKGNSLDKGPNVDTALKKVKCSYSMGQFLLPLTLVHIATAFELVKLAIWNAPFHSSRGKTAGRCLSLLESTLIRSDFTVLLSLGYWHDYR